MIISELLRRHTQYDRTFTATEYDAGRPFTGIEQLNSDLCISHLMLTKLQKSLRSPEAAEIPPVATNRTFVYDQSLLFEHERYNEPLFGVFIGGKLCERAAQSLESFTSLEEGVLSTVTSESGLAAYLSTYAIDEMFNLALFTDRVAAQDWINDPVHNLALQHMTNFFKYIKIHTVSVGLPTTGLLSDGSFTLDPIHSNYFEFKYRGLRSWTADRRYH